MSLIAHDMSSNQLAEVKECDNESGSDASSREISLHLIENSPRQVTIKNLAATLRAKPII